MRHERWSQICLSIERRELIIGNRQRYHQLRFAKHSTTVRVFWFTLTQFECSGLHLRIEAGTRGEWGREIDGTASWWHDVGTPGRPKFPGTAFVFGLAPVLFMFNVDATNLTFSPRLAHGNDLKLTKGQVRERWWWKRTPTHWISDEKRRKSGAGIHFAGKSPTQPRSIRVAFAHSPLTST